MTPLNEDKERQVVFLRELVLANILSFGPSQGPLRLGPLNVLIGPNGSGKSNLIDALSLLRAAAGDLRTVIRRGGGVTEWVWKGSQPDWAAMIDAVVENPEGGQPLRHALYFMAENQNFRLCDERIENEAPYGGHDAPHLYYRYQVGRPIINVRGEERRLAAETVEPDVSIVAQRRDPDTYPEITYLAEAYADIRIFREWAFGRNTIFREPQKADMRNDRLEEDFSNLALFLKRLQRVSRTKRAILEALRDLYAGIDDVDATIDGGTVQLFFGEGDFTIPATRLSDGSLRYLCLLAILLDPTPPRLVCIEEPELGLHPDILPKVADLLVQASQRTQLIVTTHSDIIVDALTEQPEAVIVCEKHAGQTEMRRLDGESLAGWLRDYRLGALWMAGQLGGTRW